MWAALNDLERVAPCLPGAAITGHDEDGTYHGTFTVKLGPMTAAYNGTIKIEDADESTHTATLKARGTDKRGQGGANATIVNTLSANDGATRVEAVTDFTITGRLAQFGRGGMMEDVSNRLLREFASCLQTRLVDEAEPEPAAAAPSDGGPVPPSAPPPRAARRRRPPRRSRAARCSSPCCGSGSSGSSAGGSDAPTRRPRLRRRARTSTAAGWRPAARSRRRSPLRPRPGAAAAARLVASAR